MYLTIYKFKNSIKHHFTSLLDLMLSRVQTSIDETIFIFGFYPSHPETLVDIPVATGAERPEGEMNRFTAFCHRRNHLFEIEYLFECDGMKNNFFWDVARCEEQMMAVETYWTSMRAAVTSDSAFDITEMPQVIGICRISETVEEQVKYMLSKLISHNREMELVTTTHAEIVAVSSLLETLVQKTLWKGPFLILSDTISEWKEALSKSKNIKVLTFIGNAQHRDILKSCVFPVFSVACEKIPNTYNYNVLITNRRIHNEEKEFLQSIFWLIAVNWTNQNISIRSKLEIRKKPQRNSEKPDPNTCFAPTHWSQRSIEITEMFSSDDD